MSRSSTLFWQKQREGNRDYDLFLPIIEMTVSDVWDTVFWLPQPVSIKASVIENLYRDASGECPVIKAPTAPPCASGRFGCWTCTVVRKDKSAQKLIESGYDELVPFLQFRNWLSDIRNDPQMRWPNRRNGNAGMGPFTLEARKAILKRIDRLEDLTGHCIIDAEERGVIAGLWQLDQFPRLSFKPLQ